MSTRSEYKGGILTFFDPAKNNLITHRDSRYRWHDDFDTYTTIAAAASRANGNPWVQDITGAAPPTVALTADGSGGIVTCTLTSASQAQDAAVHFDDNRHIDLDRSPIVQFYARLTTLPTTGTAFAALGLIGDHAATFSSTTYNAGFTVGASGVLTCAIDDNATPTTATATPTIAVNTWYAFRIEALSKSAIRFFLDGALVGGSTTFNYAATAGANSTLQPYFGVHKASGTGVGTLVVDSVDVWMD
jgi:hypothetical protein